MAETVTLSYVAALTLLFVCILIFSWIGKKSESLIRKLIVGVGMVPGLIGALYGFSLAFTHGNTREVLPVMSAWLLLEFGALQLTRMIKEYKIVPK